MNSCSKGFSWCAGGSPDCHGDHQAITYVTSTLGSGAPIKLGDEDAPLTIGTGLHYSELDGDGAPRVVIHIQGGSRDIDVQVELRLGEAHELEELLLRANEYAAAVTLASVPKYFKEIVLPDNASAAS